MKFTDSVATAVGIVIAHRGAHTRMNLMDDVNLMRLGDRALETVCGGHLGPYLGKGLAAGLLFVAPGIVPKLTGAKDQETATIATAGVTWGALAGWAGHTFLKHRML